MLYHTRQQAHIPDLDRFQLGQVHLLQLQQAFLQRLHHVLLVDPFWDRDGVFADGENPYAFKRRVGTGVGEIDFDVGWNNESLKIRRSIEGVGKGGEGIWGISAEHPEFRTVHDEEVSSRQGVDVKSLEGRKLIGE